MNKVISIVGQQGSGKSTIAELLCRHNFVGAQHIEVSDVVKERFNRSDRLELTKTHTYSLEDPDWLGNDIIRRARSNFLILSGVREKEVHETLQKNNNILIIEVWCPLQERYARVKDQYPSYKDFLVQDNAELLMGLADVLEGRPYPMFVTSWSKPVETAKRIAERYSFNTHTIQEDDYGYRIHNTDFIPR